MFTVLILLLASIGAGYLFRRSGDMRRILSRTTPITIFILLLIFGMSIGSNESILSNLHKDGVKAATIAVLGVVGSVVSSLCFRLINKKGGAR